MSESEIVFNGPPPVGHGGIIATLRAALDEHPGEWASVSVGKSVAPVRAQYLRKLGYEAVSRQDMLYARKPVA